MRLNLNKSLTHIQEQVSPDSLTNSCSGEGCQVSLTDIPIQKVVIDVEKEFDAHAEKAKNGVIGCYFTTMLLKRPS